MLLLRSLGHNRRVQLGDASSRVLGCAGLTPHGSTLRLRYNPASLHATPAIISKTRIIADPWRCFRRLRNFTAKENGS